MTPPDEYAKKADELMTNIDSYWDSDEAIKNLAAALRRQAIESRNEALEEAAKVASGWKDYNVLFLKTTPVDVMKIRRKISASIRLLKSDLETKGESGKHQVRVSCEKCKIYFQ